MKAITTEKRARHWAAEILAMPASAREPAYACVPADDVATVRHYVTDAIDKRRTFAVYKIISAKTRAARTQLLDDVPAEDKEAVREWVGKIFEKRRAARESANVADSVTATRTEVSG